MRRICEESSHEEAQSKCEELCSIVNEENVTHVSSLSLSLFLCEFLELATAVDVASASNHLTSVHKEQMIISCGEKEKLVKCDFSTNCALCCGWCVCDDESTLFPFSGHKVHTYSLTYTHTHTHTHTLITLGIASPTQQTKDQLFFSLSLFLSFYLSSH